MKARRGQSRRDQPPTTETRPSSPLTFVESMETLRRSAGTKLDDDNSELFVFCTRHVIFCLGPEDKLYSIIKAQEKLLLFPNLLGEEIADIITDPVINSGT